MIVQTISVVSGAVTHGVCIFVFYFKLEWGFAGVCWATSMVFIGRLLSTQLCIYYIDFEWYKDVSFMSKETFTNLGPLL